MALTRPSANQSCKKKRLTGREGDDVAEEYKDAEDEIGRADMCGGEGEGLSGQGGRRCAARASYKDSAKERARERKRETEWEWESEWKGEGKRERDAISRKREGLPAVTEYQLLSSSSVGERKSKSCWML